MTISVGVPTAPPALPVLHMMEAGLLGENVTIDLNVWNSPEELLAMVQGLSLIHILPYFLSACGSALGLCWKSGIAAEVIGMPEGSIGEQLQQAKVYLDTPDLFAWTLVIVLVSLAFERAFLALLRRGARAMERM